MQKPLYLAMILVTCMISANQAVGQTVINVHIDQPDPLIADAGRDTVIFEGDTIKIGGTPAVMNGNPDYTYNWFPKNDLDDGTIANPLVSPKNDVTYSLLVIDSRGCISGDEIHINIEPTVGINSLDPGFTYSLYPNPVNSLLMLELKNFEFEKFEIEIVSSSGVIILKEEYPGDVKAISMSLEGIKKGMYFLNILVQDHKISTEKFLIK